MTTAASFPPFYMVACARWEAFDARAAAMLARAASAPSATAALSAALGVDPLMARGDFFRHVFGDAEDVRGAQAVMCLRVQLLPVLLQRAVVAVMVMHAQWLSKSVLRYCSDRARAHVRDQVPQPQPRPSAAPARACCSPRAPVWLLPPPPSNHVAYLLARDVGGAR